MFNYSFHWRSAFKALPDMLGGAWVTLETAALSMILGVLIALLLTVMRQMKNPLLKGFADTWVSIARNTPSLFQIYILYFGLGSFGLHVSSWVALLAGITFNNAGYLAENFRGGLKAVPDTQMRAARSLGMSAFQAYRMIIVPQLLRIVYYPDEPDGLGGADDLAGRGGGPEQRPHRRDPGLQRAHLPHLRVLRPGRGALLPHRQGHRGGRPPAELATVPLLGEARMFSTSFTAGDLMFLLQGAWVTVKLTVGAMLIGTLAGIVLGWLRATLPRATMPVGWFLDIFRSVPLLIQFVLFNSLKSIVGLNWSAFTVGCLVLGVYAAAFCTEIIRSGILAVGPNIRRASRSLGLTYWQDLRYIVLPLAARVAFPGWLNLVLGVMKDTALVMWIGIVELLRASQTIVTRIQEPLLVLCIAGVIYYLMSWVVARLGARLEQRWQEND